MSDLELVARRVTETLRGEGGTDKPRYVDGVNVGGDISALVREGGNAYFADIDYSDKTVSFWQCRRHLSRLRDMLLGRSDAAPVDDIIAGIDFWVENNFINPNWWHNRIGTPSDLAAICLLLGNKLGDERLERCLKIISRGSFSRDPAILKDTGANLLWGVRITIYYAILTRDENLLQAASDRFAREITTEGFEGIKPDFSFHQHGPQLYSCGYGRSFTDDSAKLLYMLAGTKFAPEKEKYRLFEYFVLEGQRYFTRGKSVDYLAVGREIARSGSLSSEAIKSAVSHMLRTPGYERHSELEEYYHLLEGSADGFSGTKYFEHSYFLSHNRPQFHIGVRGAHADFVSTEWGNGENRLGVNLARGGNVCIMANGREYFDIAPVWDWAMLPGTVSPHYTDDEMRMHTGGWAGPRGKNRDCTGYARDGLGALAIRLEGDGLTGFLAYVAFDDGLLMFGCGIGGPDGTRMTIDQCIARDSGADGTFFLNRGESAENGGFKYVNLCDSVLHRSVQNRTGSWKRVNDAASDENISMPVFTLYYEQPTDFACAVVTPDADMAAIKEIYNTPEKQGAAFADGRKVIVTRGADGTKITIE